MQKLLLGLWVFDTAGTGFSNADIRLATSSAMALIFRFSYPFDISKVSFLIAAGVPSL